MRLLDLLKRIENGTEMLCPECGAVLPQDKDHGHKPDCELKAAIDHFTRVSEIPFAARTLEDIRYGAPLNPLDFEGAK